MRGFMLSIRHFFMLIVICLTFSSASMAETIFSTVGIPPAPNFCDQSNHGVGCVYYAGNNWFGRGALLGQQFTYSQDFTVTSVAVLAYSDSLFTSNAVTFQIVTDNSGLPGAAVMGTLTGTAGTYPTQYNDPPVMTTLTPTSVINLPAGTYWVIATGSTPGLSHWVWTWRGSEPELLAQNYGTGWTTNTTDNQYHRYAVDIEGTVVPEPTSALLLVTGTLISLVSHRARRAR